MWYILVAVLVAVMAIRLIKVSLYWTDKGIPYESFPSYIWRMTSFNRRVIGDMMIEVSERYGPVFGSYRGLTPALVVSDSEFGKEVLIKQFSNFFNRSLEIKTGKPLWDNMIMQQPYEEWKILRTVMSNTFTTSKMRGIILKLDKVAKRLVARFDDLASDSDGSKVLVVSRYTKGYGADSMIAISFGFDINCIDDPDNKFVKYASKLIRPGITILLFLMAPQFMRYIPFLDFPSKEVIQFFEDAAKKMLTEKRLKLDEAIKNGTTDIMDLHLIAQREDKTGKITDQILASQAFLFLIGGLEQTSAILELVIFYLAVHPEVQQRVHDEINSVMGERQDIQYEDVQKMKYLEACILESVRITAVSPFLDRVCSTSTEIAGLSIEKGTVVEINIAAIHMNPKYFPDPDKYIPERFLKDENDSQQTGTFLIFGDGPRNCVGRRIALMNMQVLLVNLFCKYKLEPCDETPKSPLKLKPGLRFSDNLEKTVVIRLTRHQ